MAWTDTEIKHNGSRIIRMVIVAIPNESRRRRRAIMPLPFGVRRVSLSLFNDRIGKLKHWRINRYFHFQTQYYLSHAAEKGVGVERESAEVSIEDERECIKRREKEECAKRERGG